MKKSDRHPQTAKWCRRVRKHETEANAHSLSSPERVTAPPPARRSHTCAEPGCVQAFEAVAMSSGTHRFAKAYRLASESTFSSGGSRTLGEAQRCPHADRPSPQA